MVKTIFYDSLINGQTYSSNKKIDVLNPSNNKSIGKLSDIGAKGTEKAVVAAHDAFSKWSKTTAEVRSKILKNWYNLIIKDQKVLAEIITLETGKPFSESLTEVTYGASFIQWFAEQTKRVSGNILSSPDRKKMLVMKQPIGVVSAITPWNFPVAMVTRKASAAIDAGCTVVLKPSELKSISAVK